MRRQENRLGGMTARGAAIPGHYCSAATRAGALGAATTRRVLDTAVRRDTGTSRSERASNRSLHAVGLCTCRSAM